MTRSPSDDPDALVIGAGPAGAVAAFRLAQFGFRTRLIDRAPFPRRKLCGGCLAATGRAILLRIGLGSLSSLTNARVLHRFDLRAGHRAATIRVPASTVVDRAVFDQELVNAASEAGACFQDQTAATVNADGSVELKSPQRPIEKIRPTVIIVADGLKGRSLRQLNDFGWHTSPRSYVGIGAIGEHFPETLQRDAITMFHARHGYLGLVELPGGTVDLAAAVSPRWIARQRGRPVLESLIDSFGLSRQSLGDLERNPGEPELTRRRKSVEKDGRIFLCGDASGYIEPFTGEGMSWAIAAGDAVATHASGVLRGEYKPGAWTQRVRRGARRATPCRVVRVLLRTPGVARSLVTVCNALPAASTLASSSIKLAFPEPHSIIRGVGR